MTAPELRDKQYLGEPINTMKRDLAFTMEIKKGGRALISFLGTMLTEFVLIGSQITLISCQFYRSERF